VCTATASSSGLPGASQHGQLPPPGSIPADASPCAQARMGIAPTAGYDPVLLLAALEEIEARQAAIGWLLEADLLCRCLV
jgi:hypothetical protein